MNINRKNYLIDKSFQLKFCFYVCGLVFICGLIYPYTIYGIFDVFIQHIVRPEDLNKFSKYKVDLLWGLIIYHLAFTLIVFMASLFQSHRIAGPIYKIRLYLKNYLLNQNNFPIVFRKGDYFKNLQNDLNIFIEGIDKKEEVTMKNINLAKERLQTMLESNALSEGPIQDEVSQKLTIIKEELKEIKLLLE